MSLLVPVSSFINVGLAQVTACVAPALASVSAPAISESAKVPKLKAPPIDRASGPSLTADTILSEKLAQFVTAYERVMSLIQRNESSIATAETEQDSTRLQQAIETSATRVIEQVGLTRSEYLQLLSLANLDDEFGEKGVTMLQEKP